MTRGMSESQLYAPWRIDYIRSLEKQGGCFLCEAAADPQARRERLVLWTTPLSIVMLNRYPYNNGHLLVSPLAHKAELEDLLPEELADMQTQTVRAMGVLRRAMSPHGFNIGINIGRCAGAGLPGHIHQHVVPRWNGDVNFMSVVGEVRVVPQSLSRLWEELTRVRGQEDSK